MIKKSHIKYIFYAILLGALFFIGRYSKPDADLVGWEKEKKAILQTQQDLRDSLNLVIVDQANDVLLLEEKDSIHIIEIEKFREKDIEQDKKLRNAYNELRKLGSTELTEYMIKEYEKHN